MKYSSIIMHPMKMRPKTHSPKKKNHKSVLVQPKRVVSRPDELKGGEETEITAQIFAHEEGCRGWMVVCAAFLNIFILDGVTYTFGSILPDIATDLNVSDSLVALINSISVALYFIGSPLASALINRFGFRECAMMGSMISSFSLLISYFITKYGLLCLFYGAIAGFGYSLINMSSSLVVGFYFEKLRSIAMAVATCGSSVGVMTLFPLNSYLVKLGGWRSTTLLHSGMLGLIFFLAMSFRPLLSFTVTKTEEDPALTVTYLPSVISTSIQPQRVLSLKIRPENLVSTATERLFGAVSNINFPTAAAVVVEETPTTTAQVPGLSNANVSKLTLTANNPPGGNITRRQLKQAQSIISRCSQQQDNKPNLPFEINIADHHRHSDTKHSCWARLCHWEPHIPHSRPMYRDDAFYEGKLEDLPVHQKSTLYSTVEAKTGIEYQMAVTRAATVTDVTEVRGVFTTAIRRVLATMMDPKLLRKCSFVLLCSSGFFTYLGFLVPYVFLQDRNLNAGVDPKHCTLFVSAIGLSNAFGRLVLGSLANKLDPIKLFVFCCTLAGISTIVSHLSYSLYYQYCYCVVFGFSISCVACLRSIILVSLYGLDKLTNATGMMLIFLGLGNLVSTPIAGILKNLFGYNIAFYVAGTFIMLSGLILIPLKSVSVRENK